MPSLPWYYVTLFIWDLLSSETMEPRVRERKVSPEVKWSPSAAKERPEPSWGYVLWSGGFWRTVLQLRRHLSL